MRDMSEKLFELIKQKLTIAEICKALSLSNRQIYNILRMMENKGFEFIRQYYDNGNIVYTPKTMIDTSSQKRYMNIIAENPDKFTAVAISDLHIGSKDQRLDAINKVYEYCVKEGIHIIFICGDLIDGTYGGEKLIKNTEEQIRFLLNNYPFDHSILNCAILGDHDYSVLKETSQNLATTLKNYRHDIVPIGFGLGEINIKKGKIVLMHKFNHKYQKDYDKIVSETILHNDLVLQGHYHSPFMVQKNIKSNYIVNVPSLSDMRDLKKEPVPSAIRIEIQFYKDYYSQVNLNKLLIKDSISVSKHCETIKLKIKGLKMPR